MSEARKILESGQLVRSGETPPTEQELRVVESALDFVFPASYREFVALGGLAEMRIHHEVLAPSKIEANSAYLPDADHVPFADNGCGDLYCWPKGHEDPPVVFGDHETGEYSPDSASFVDWLRKNKF